MKYIKLFESFSGDKVKIEIELRGESPDYNYGCTAVGVGYTSREAAMYCMMACFTFLRDGDSPVSKDLKDFDDLADDFLQEDEKKKALDLLEKGEILTSPNIMKSLPPEFFDEFDNNGMGWNLDDPSFFSGHSDSVYAEASIDKALPSSSVGGFILDSYNDPTY
jgi:hypothetical protein